MDILEKLEILARQMFFRGSWDSDLETIKEAIIEIKHLRDSLRNNNENLSL